MKKNIFTLLLTFIIMFIPTLIVNASDSFDAGECIEGFGSITLKETGSNNDAGGKVVFQNKQNNLTWSTKTVTFDAKVESTTGHKIKTIGYSISSKDGYSCTGVIKGTSIENNTGHVTVSVVIDKGYVSKMAFWGRSVNRSNPSKGDMTESNTINVKREMTDAELQEIDEELDITTGEKLECDTLDDLLGKYWTWVMILMPVITLLLMTIDFVGAMLASDSDALKKASGKALKRTVALVILLLLPVIINLLFKIFSIETCF